MPKTRDDLIGQVLIELSVAAAGQPNSAEDSKTVDDVLDGIAHDLAVRRVYYFPDFQEIPDSAFLYLAKYTAEMCSAAFGRPEDAAAMEAAENKLRAQTRIVNENPHALRVDRALLPRRRLGTYSF